MKKIKDFLFMVISLIFAIGGSAYAQPAVSREKISQNIPQEVRKHIEALYLPDAKDRVFAIKALTILGKRSEPAVPFLIGILSDNDWFVRKEAAWILGRLEDPRAIEPLIRLLNEKNRYVTGEAVEALTKIGRPAVTPLLAALKYKNVDIRKNVVTVLGNIGDHQAIDPLIHLLDDHDLGVHRQIASSLQKFGGVAEKRLINDLKHGEIHARENAAWALGKIGSEEAEKPLIAALTGKSAWLRENAAGSLGEIGTQQAVRPLIKALSDHETVVATKAAEALKTITGQDFGLAPAAWQKWQDDH
ncbi:MAG: HEAT repeat domain-containing protein [bacterium]